MSEPQPIETAPHDGTRVLVFVPGNDKFRSGWNSAHWFEEQTVNGVWNGWICGGDVWSDEAIHLDNPEPTHWVPLPPPPGT